MASSRVRLVARVGSGGSPLQRFIVISALVHVVLAAGLILVPRLFGRGPKIPPDAMIVELAPAFPSAPRPAPPQPPAPEVRSEPAEGVRVETKKPPEKPKPLPPKEEPEEEPVREEPPVEAPDDSAAEAAEAAAGLQGGMIGGPDAGHAVAPMAGGDLEFAWYRASVTAALHSHWQRPVLSGVREELAVTIAFDILRDGRVVRVRVETSSGVPSLDRSALRAVSDASPLPALPPNWREPTLEAVFIFRLYPEQF